MHETLAGYPVVIELPVQWGDMDALRHVNNTVYLRYFESARIALFNQLDYQRVMHDTGVGPILHSISCRFKFPLTYPDTVWVGVRVTEIAEDRFTVHHIVVSQRHGRLAAEGDGILVTYDYRAHHKTPIPDVWRQPIEAMAKQT